MKKTLYFSLNSDNKNIKDIKLFPAGDLEYLRGLNEKFDLHIIHPREYDFKNMTVPNSYGVEITDNTITFYERKGEHIPQGDAFFVFSSGGGHNLGLEFARNHISFLKYLRDNNNFQYFFNSPETQEMMLKDKLVELSSEFDGVAKTKEFSRENLEDMLSTYGSVIAKPIAGAKGSGVVKLKSSDDLEKLISSLQPNNLESTDDLEKLTSLQPNNLESYLSSNYVLQEPLSGPEKRLIVLDGKYLGARVHINRSTPWEENNPDHRTEIYTPTEKEIKLAEQVAKRVGATIAGVDFIGDKINELNGGGTDTAFRDRETKEIFYNLAPWVVQKIYDIVHG